MTVGTVSPSDDLTGSTSDGLESFSSILTRTTFETLDHVDVTHPPTPHAVEQMLLASVNAAIRSRNADKGLAATEKIIPLKQLAHWQIAQVLLRLHHVIRIAPNVKDTDREYDVLAIYQTEGPGQGTYTASEDDIRTVARRYNTQLSLKDFDEVLAILREDSPRTHQCAHPDLIAVNNGVFVYRDEPIDITVNGTTFHCEPKSLIPFDPALVFLAKCHINYVPNPPNPVILNPDDQTQWDVCSWIHDFYHIDGDDEFNEKYTGMADLIWEIIGAMIRPHVSWGKTAWFYSEQGSNGKGTLCALMRNLCGPRAHTSIPLSDFGKDFALEPLVRATAIIVDENDVGTFIDKAANLKAIVTHDVIQIDRKYRMPIAYQFFGFMVQCLNEFPRVKDKSESFYRRQLFVPFEKSFTHRERTYIKDDYLQRTEVLEYVLWYVLHRAGASTPGQYYQLSEPPATRAMLHEYKETNDPVRAFWSEFRDQFVWDLLPFTFTYDLYKSWFSDVSPSGSPVGYRQFISDLVAILRTDDQWDCPDKNRKIKTSTRMDESEPLIARYDLKQWMNPHYSGSDRQRKCHPDKQISYRGVVRRHTRLNDGSLSESALPAEAALVTDSALTDEE